jgi:hypothetical protein
LHQEKQRVTSGYFFFFAADFFLGAGFFALDFVAMVFNFSAG